MGGFECQLWLTRSGYIDAINCRHKRVWKRIGLPETASPSSVRCLRLFVGRNIAVDQAGNIVAVLFLLLEEGIVVVGAFILKFDIVFH